jgi:tripartite-type tricarboxylate transporter receptor subunit TctC
MLFWYADMKFSRRRTFLRLAAGAGALSIIAVVPNDGAWAQATKVIRIVVPYPPGASSDIPIRVLAEQIGRTRGASFVIENRPGAGGTIGTEAVARAAPDGSTLLIASNPLVIDPHLRKVNYDPMSSFEPICKLVNTPTVLVVHGASPYRTFADLISAARAQPGVLTLASAGPATATSLAFEMLKRAANVDMAFVPYPGAAPTINAILGEHVTSALAQYPASAEHLKFGKLRALAVPSRERIDPLPEVPTTIELGYSDVEADVWNGLFAPANSPREILSELSEWFAAALQDGDVKAKLVLQGFYPVGTCGADFGKLLRKQYDDYGRIIRDANIKVQ